MAMYLTNGTLNYNLTKEYILTPEQIAERNNMIPDYPDPNDLRFQTTPSVYTIENDSLYRDGELVGKIYNNKTGMLVEVTEVTDNIITVKDTEEQSNGGDIPLVVVQKLTGKEIVVTPPSTHDYVEIGGIKWATMNIGAESVTDTGLYFQWGDTQGYTAEQVGTDKMFNWANYKYSDNGTTAMTKYKGDDYTVLQPEDDAVTAAWGGSWRMPTTAEFQTLGAAVTSAWTTNYQGVEGCNGLLLTGKNGTADEGKTLFFPACGDCDYGSVFYVGSYGFYWSSSLYSSSVQSAYYLYFSSGDVFWQSSYGRYYGYAVRGVLGE